MVIRNVKVFDGERLTTPTHVVIEDGYIKSVGAEVPPDSDVIDGEGKTLLPGFIDTHMHIDNRDNCVLAAKYGVTMLLDQMCNNTEHGESLHREFKLLGEAGLSNFCCR